jgi:hypothetical protein
MSLTIGLAEAKARLSEIIDRVEAGETNRHRSQRRAGRGAPALATADDRGSDRTDPSDRAAGCET